MGGVPLRDFGGSFRGGRLAVGDRIDPELIFLKSNSTVSATLSSEVSMNPHKQLASGECLDFDFAELLVSQELLRTHGILFAAGFLEQFGTEISLAACRMVQRRQWNDDNMPNG